MITEHPLRIFITSYCKAANIFQIIFFTKVAAFPCSPKLDLLAEFPHSFLSILFQKASLEDTLRNTELRNNMEMEKYNALIMRLEEELTNLRANIHQQTQDYEALLNMKMKLEAEIGTYKSLLDGGDFK